LRDFTRREWSIPDLERHVLEAISRRYREFLDRGSEPGRLAWLDRACYLDQEVVVKQDGDIVAGRLHGITASGALVILTGHGPAEIVAGDLVRGPRPI
jgi:biotin-(acetyl-CoA carboxylase) ligase